MITSNKSSSSNDAHPVRRRRKDARPGELLDAAIAVFARTGFHAASMDEIGARAGVSKGTVYLYFGTKEHLFSEAVRHGTEALLERTERFVAEEQGSAPRMLRRLVSTWDLIAAGESTGAVLKLLLIESSALPSVAQYTEKLFEHMHALIQTLVERGLRDGDFRPCSSTLVARIICAALCWHALGRCSAELMCGPAEEDLYSHVELVLHGLAKAGWDSGNSNCA